jgi:hypothetical protein
MNMLQRAARCADRDFAAALLVTVLHIKGEAVALATLPERAKWRAMPIAARMRELAGWLTAECFECIEAETPHAESAESAERVARS